MQDIVHYFSSIFSLARINIKYSYFWIYLIIFIYTGAQRKRQRPVVDSISSEDEEVIREIIMEMRNQK